MLSLTIADKETLYRAVPKNPIMWKFEMNRPSSALFKDERGVSVDRDGGRSERQVIDDFNIRLPGKGLVSIGAKICREIGTEPVAKPLADNIYHAEIYDCDGNPQIVRSKLKKMSEAVKVVRSPEFD